MHPIKGTHHTLEDDEPDPSSFPFEFKEDLFEDFGNAMNLSVQVRPLVHSAPSEDDGPQNEPFLVEHIKGLSAIMSHEWLAEMELSTEVARIIAPSHILPCVFKGTTIEAHYCPTVGMNIILKALAKNLYPNESLIPSHKLLKIILGVILESYEVMRSIPLRIRDSEYHLDFHIYDVSDTSLLVGLPLGTLFQGRPNQGLLNLKLGSSPIAMSLARSSNAIVEPKPEQDPIEDVLIASLEDMAQPALDDENFIQGEEELVEHVKLDHTEVPSQPSIELKPLPSGLRYAFLNNNRETSVIISDKLAQEETRKLVVVLERHKLAISYSLQDLKGSSPALCTHRIPIDPDSSPSRETQRRLNNAM